MPPVGAEPAYPWSADGLEKSIELGKVLPFLLILNSVYCRLTEQVGPGSS